MGFLEYKDGSIYKNQCKTPHYQKEGQKPRFSQYRKSIWQNPAPFHKKKTQQNRNRRKLFRHPKHHKWKFTSIISNGEKLKAFPLRTCLFKVTWVYI